MKVVKIADPAHPAYSQYGLYASQHLAPDSFILHYSGFVHNAVETNDKSDYDLSLDRELGIGIDASTSGNEARFINDYRGVPGHSDRGPNADFRDCWVACGSGLEEKTIGVYVLGAGKSGKRAMGIAKGEEILVSYGKGFWTNRNGVGD